MGKGIRKNMGVNGVALTPALLVAVNGREHFTGRVVARYERREDGGRVVEPLQLYEHYRPIDSGLGRY